MPTYIVNKQIEYRQATGDKETVILFSEFCLYFKDNGVFEDPGTYRAAANVSGQSVDN